MTSPPRFWQRRSWPAIALLPVAGLFNALVVLRRGCYRAGLLQRTDFERPVIVIGNLSVGGTGKSPVVAWLARQLREAGYRPGIVSRGYGGRGHDQPVLVAATDDPANCGDEPVMHAWLTGLPVSVCRRRSRAVRLLLDRQLADVVISDDGLQHHAMGRWRECVVVDGQRGLGNGWPLPAGPLRERASRLGEVDAVIVQRSSDAALDDRWAYAASGTFQLCVSGVMRLSDGRQLGVDSLSGQSVVALSGLGNPARFNAAVASLAGTVQPETRPDHHVYTADDPVFSGDRLVVTTAKDAVKIARLPVALERIHVLLVDVDPDDRMRCWAASLCQDLHRQWPVEERIDGG